MPTFALVKKVLSIVFCFVYLLSSAGVHVNLHYCAGKIKSISLTHSDEADCCGKMMKKKKDCCKEKAFSYQVKDNQKHADKALILKNFFSATDLVIPAGDSFLSTKNAGSGLVYIEPPDIDAGRLFISIRLLRI